jgi:hypothetical protein
LAIDGAAEPQSNAEDDVGDAAAAPADPAQPTPQGAADDAAQAVES